MEPLASLLPLSPVKTVARPVKGTIFSAKKELPGTLTARFLAGSKLTRKRRKNRPFGTDAMRCTSRIKRYYTTALTRRPFYVRA